MLLLQTKWKTLVSSWCLEWDCWHREVVRSELVRWEIPRMSRTSAAPHQGPCVRQACPHPPEAIANASRIPALAWCAEFPGWWPSSPAGFFSCLHPFRSERALHSGVLRSSLGPHFIRYCSSFQTLFSLSQTLYWGQEFLPLSTTSLWMKGSVSFLLSWKFSLPPLGIL